MTRFWTTGLAAAALASVSGQALALSCAQPKIERSFNWWVDAEETYYIGVGTLTAIEPLPRIPNVDELSTGTPKPDLTAEYRFEGRLLDGDQNVPYSALIKVKVDCAGPWCGGFPTDGTSGLMPLHVRDPFDLQLRVGPCPGTIFDASVEATVAECIRAGRCADPN